MRLVVFDDDPAQAEELLAKVMRHPRSSQFDAEVITGIDELPMGTKMVRSMEYYNIAGAMSEKPFDGVNIVVARYTDGTTSTYKVIYPTK